MDPTASMTRHYASPPPGHPWKFLKYPSAVASARHDTAMDRASDSNEDRSVNIRDACYPGETRSDSEAAASAGGTATSIQSRVDEDSPPHRTTQPTADRTSLATGISISQLLRLQEYSHCLESSIGESTDDGDFLMMSARQWQQQKSRERGHTRGRKTQIAHAKERHGRGENAYAKADTRLAFPFRRLLSVRRRRDGGFEFKVDWDTTWVGRKDLQGEKAKKMADNLVERFVRRNQRLGV
ncbi:hypothetical protein Purlil1_13936 [Purpureocillium lilacinum]|uniref:Uncharacterized protein n=1 Tax=Purpureocillium lilacinum TaxID=33203 RepID=A0ABR0BCP8_PURLI|nr:hypothetical protein Purlil1_13936 [Purpureocillium lilacinum]